MRPFAAVERFFERVFERPTARLFHARLQPVQLQHRLERAMENDRLTSSGRTLVPNRYALHLNPQDLASFEGYAPALAGELADACLAYARHRHYTLADRPQVTLVPDADVAVGEVRAAARFATPGAPAPDHTREAAGQGGSVAAVASAAENGGRESPAVPSGTGPSGREAPAEGPWLEHPDAPPDHTMVFQVPRVRSPSASLRVVYPDGSRRLVTLDGGLLSVGRAADNDVVLPDSRVSRHHLRIQPRSGALILTDLGSTNGTRVNGYPVDEVALGDGDTIELGDSTLVVESAAGR